MDKTDCLGFVIGPDGLRMETPKIQVIRGWPTPRKGKDVQSFLGFAIFYRRFIASYSDITAPPTRLTRRGASWVWSPQCEPFDSSERPLFRHTSSTISTHPFLQWSRDMPLITPSPVFSRYTLRMFEFTPRVLQSQLIWCRAQLGHSRQGDPRHLRSVQGLATLSRVSSPYDRRDHGPQESGVLPFYRDVTDHQARWSGFLSAFNMVFRFRPGTLGEKRILILGERIST